VGLGVGGCETFYNEKQKRDELHELFQGLKGDNDQSINGSIDKACDIETVATYFHQFVTWIGIISELN